MTESRILALEEENLEADLGESEADLERPEADLEELEADLEELEADLGEQEADLVALEDPEVLQKEARRAALGVHAAIGLLH